MILDGIRFVLLHIHVKGYINAIQQVKIVNCFILPFCDGL